MRFDASLTGDKRTLLFLRKLGREGQKAITRATNNAGRKARTLANKEIRSDVALKSAYVRDKLRVTRATLKKPTYTINAARRGVLLTRYPHTVLKRSGITVRIKAGAGRRKFRHAFITTVKAGGRRVSVIAEPGPKGSNGKRLRYKTGTEKIKVMYGPSVSQVFNKVRDRITPAVSLYFDEQIDKEVNQAIKRIAKS
jgi:hypothetical protein